MSEHANRLFQTAISELQKRVKRIEERKADEQILAIARSRVAEPAPINTDVEALAQLLQGGVSILVTMILGMRSPLFLYSNSMRVVVR